MKKFSRGFKNLINFATFLKSENYKKIFNKLEMYTFRSSERFTFEKYIHIPIRNNVSININMYEGEKPDKSRDKYIIYIDINVISIHFMNIHSWFLINSIYTYLFLWLQKCHEIY